MLVYAMQLCIFEYVCRQLITYVAVCLQRFLKFYCPLECLFARKSNQQRPHEKQKKFDYSPTLFLTLPPIAYKRAARVTIFVKKSFYRGAVRRPTTREDNACDANATVSSRRCTCLLTPSVLYCIYSKLSLSRLDLPLITRKSKYKNNMNRLQSTIDANYKYDMDNLEEKKTSLQYSITS